MVKITIPGFICKITDEEKKELEELMFRFGKARRRAYSLKLKGVWKADIERILQDETGLNSRYVKDAYHSIKDLPPHVTFGGKKNQLLRMRGKISKEEYGKRRNSILISRGDKSKKGNLNIRLDLNMMELRINCCNGKYIYPKVYIPEKYKEKYKKYLDGSYPYTVIIKRLNDDRGFKVCFIVDVETSEVEGERVMALDVNAGHTDFALTCLPALKGEGSRHGNTRTGRLAVDRIRLGQRAVLGQHIADRIIDVIARNSLINFLVQARRCLEYKKRAFLPALKGKASSPQRCVMDKKTGKVVAVGKFHHHETQYVRRGRRMYLLHKLVDRVGAIARHFDADVVVGKLETSNFNGSRKANRVIHNVPQFKFRQILSYKLPLKFGVRVKEYSEAYTSKVGKVLGNLIGLDVHKSSAISFALKVVDYSRFKLILSEVRSNDACGRLRARRRRGSGLTAPCQSLRLAGDEALQRLTGDSWYPVLSAFAESVKANLTGRIWHVKIC